MQYENIQVEHSETWKALLRRISFVKEYTGKEIIKKETDKYLNEIEGFVKVESDSNVKQLFEKQSNIREMI